MPLLSLLRTAPDRPLVAAACVYPGTSGSTVGVVCLVVERLSIIRGVHSSKRERRNLGPCNDALAGMLVADTEQGRDVSEPVGRLPVRIQRDDALTVRIERAFQDTCSYLDRRRFS